MKFSMIARLKYEESKILPDKISFFDHWGWGAAPPYILPEVSPLVPAFRHRIRNRFLFALQGVGDIELNTIVVSVAFLVLIFPRDFTPL